MRSKFEKALESSGLFQHIKESERELAGDTDGGEGKKAEHRRKAPAKSGAGLESATASNFDRVFDSPPLLEEILRRNGNRKISPSPGYITSWDVDDLLAPLQTSAEQCVYRQLYRLSFGLQNTTCFVGQGSLAERCNLSRGTVRTALAGLLRKKHIEELETINQKDVKGTVYRVFLPLEIEGLSDIDTVYGTKPVSHSDTGSIIDTAATSITGPISAIENHDKKRK